MNGITRIGVGVGAVAIGAAGFGSAHHYLKKYDMAPEHNFDQGIAWASVATMIGGAALLIVAKSGAKSGVAMKSSAVAEGVLGLGLLATGVGAVSGAIKASTLNGDRHRSAAQAEAASKKAEDARLLVEHKGEAIGSVSGDYVASLPGAEQTDAQVGTSRSVTVNPYGEVSATSTRGQGSGVAHGQAGPREHFDMPLTLNFRNVGDRNQDLVPPHTYSTLAAAVAGTATYAGADVILKEGDKYTSHLLNDGQLLDRRLGENSKFKISDPRVVAVVGGDTRSKDGSMDEFVFEKGPGDTFGFRGNTQRIYQPS